MQHQAPCVSHTHSHLEVGREGVGQAHGAREGRQDEVAHLHTRRRDGVAQREVVLAQELGEVVQQHLRYSTGSTSGQVMVCAWGWPQQLEASESVGTNYSTLACSC